MTEFTPIVKFLDEIVSTFQVEASRVGRLAAEPSHLSTTEMKRFAEVNARAATALNIRDYFKENNGNVDRASLERIIQRKMANVLGNEDTHLASIAVFNDVLSFLRTAE